MSQSSEADQLRIKRSEAGFYEGFNLVVTLSSKLLIGALVIWAALFSDQAGDFLLGIRQWSFATFGAWYIHTGVLGSAWPHVQCQL